MRFVVLRPVRCVAFLALLSLSGIPITAQVPGSKASLSSDPTPTQQTQTTGFSSADLVRRALASNAQLAAARLDIDRARSRLRQAGAIPNPTIEYQQATGRFTGSQGEWERSVVVGIPIEVAGQRGRRTNLARIETEAASTALADAERRLAADVRIAYLDVLAAERELATTTELDRIDAETARFVQVRVGEGESAPLELNLLKAEIDRQRSRRALVTGKRDAALATLKALVGAEPDERLPLIENLTVQLRNQTPPTLGEAVALALASRPDVKLARLAEQAAEAGYKLARSESAPDVTILAGYGSGQSVFDDTPIGVLRDRDRMLTLGVSISIPLFDRNQGVRDEAATAIAQARKRREFIERQVRAEVAAAFARFRASDDAASTYESGVLDRSRTNVDAIRGAYQIGAYRITELLAEQRRLADLEREFTDALAERYRALVDLESAVGTVVPADFDPGAADGAREHRTATSKYPGGDPESVTHARTSTDPDRPVFPFVIFEAADEIGSTVREPR